MKALILAAGRGTRMEALTDHCPKPLLKVNGQHLIEFHLHALQQAGIQEVIINTSYLAEQIHRTLGNGARYGVNITYSNEGPNALETAGGIVNALPLLGSEPFIVINGDVWTDYNLAQLMTKKTLKYALAHLVLVNNPGHNLKGDFGMDAQGYLTDQPTRYTYSGIGLYSPALFANQTIQKRPLAPLLKQVISEKKVCGEYYSGHWLDVGTPERLEYLRGCLNQSPKKEPKFV